MVFKMVKFQYSSLFHIKMECVILLLIKRCDWLIFWNKILNQYLIKIKILKKSLKI